ncbi:hypothetical protein B2J93_9440 [Marssonina coronariae]|uniref:N-acetyltransferase domain-containing protein n=1 Tax=Diplocarpon coronariae TaxID=2795749 RepID=A0A218YW59_9HELO|nr:hypothetical protein B2J93_9440 [Marssonina coronariae]
MPPIDSLSPPASFPPPQPPLPAVPPLTTSPLTTEPAKVAALKLVADSIAQQRQLAARAVILHPLTLAAWAALLAVISSVLFAGDWGLLCTTCAGATMACLVGVRGVTSRYLTLAEELNWDFVRNAEGEEDVILGSRYGEELIGALVLRLERNGKRAKGGRGVIRAWTVGARYRGNGVGTELLEQAVKVTRKRLGRDSRVGFAAGHANSEMVLPGLFNAGFRRREMLAGRMLRDVVAGTDRRR